MPEMTHSFDVKLYSSQSEKNYRRATHLIVLIYFISHIYQDYCGHMDENFL
jgi:hypothetical protein